MNRETRDETQRKNEAISRIYEIAKKVQEQRKKDSEVQDDVFFVIDRAILYQA